MNLTKRQQEILEFIETYVEEHGVPPSVREVGERFQIYPRAAHDHLRALERKGFIQRTPLKSRSIQVTKPRSLARSASAQPVPIVGQIAAGTPILAVENVQGELVVDKDLFKGNEFFAVRVNGDSMIEDHILDGDYAILRKQSTAEKGDVVAVLVDEAVTLKRFYPTGSGIKLQPANKRLRPMEVKPDQVRILGKLVGLLRKI